MKAVIIAHGSLKNLEILKFECDNADYIICADGGAEFAFKSGLTPNFLIGDFDSIDRSVLEYFVSCDVKIEEFPPEKDFTDTEICVNRAIELGCSEICIIAGVGGRLDHTLGNIGLLHLMNRNNIRGYIAGDDCYVYLCSDEMLIRGEKGDTVSIIPYRGDAVGVSLMGLKYPLNNALLEFGRPLGVSNVMLDNLCSIKLKSGEILVIKQNIIK